MTDHDLSAAPTDAAERAYLLKRAEDHRRLADASAEAGARSLHMRFRDLYRARAYGDLDGTFEPDASAKIPGTWSAIDG